MHINCVHFYANLPDPQCVLGFSSCVCWLIDERNRQAQSILKAQHFLNWKLSGWYDIIYVSAVLRRLCGIWNKQPALSLCTVSTVRDTSWFVTASQS